MQATAIDKKTAKFLMQMLISSSSTGINKRMEADEDEKRKERIHIYTKEEGVVALGKIEYVL